jgi:hypothetical protein
MEATCVFAAGAVEVLEKVTVVGSVTSDTADA